MAERLRRFFTSQFNGSHEPTLRNLRIGTGLSVAVIAGMLAAHAQTFLGPDGVGLGGAPSWATNPLARLLPWPIAAAPIPTIALVILAASGVVVAVDAFSSLSKLGLRQRDAFSNVAWWLPIPALVIWMSLEGWSPLFGPSIEQPMRLALLLLTLSTFTQTRPAALVREQAITSRFTEDETTPSLSNEEWFTTLAKVQVSVIYASAAYGKLYGESWRSGDALFRVFQNDQVGRFSISGESSPWFLTLGTHLAIAAEFGLATVPWWPERYRKIGILSAIGFHAAIALTMEVGLFSVTMSLLWLALWPTPIGQRRIKDA